ncbi:hypothetical protein V8D89_012341 [Ganoderma adspersum]
MSLPPPSPLFSRSSSGSSRHDYTPVGVPRVASLLSHHTESASGPEPLTHPALRDEDAVSPRKVPLGEDTTFVCCDGVDVAKLLRAVRGSLHQKALEIGANVLVDEQWSCTICGPRHRSDGTFRVYVHYAARGARSERGNPQRPVALENARDVPGLMTIVNRID